MKNKLNIIAQNLKNYSTESLILAAFQRSFGKSQINKIENCNKNDYTINVFLECLAIENYKNLINLIKGKKNKIILNGKLNDHIKKLLQINDIDENVLDEKLNPANKEKPCISESFIKFNEKIPYLNDYVNIAHERPTSRFDYDLEWNNHCYGHISSKEEILDLSHKCTLKEEEYVAYISNQKNAKAPLIGQFIINGNLVIWINRNLSLVDIPEWKIIENFISEAFFDDYPCLPYISEFSKSQKGLITMRFDCDEDIESARKVFELYKANQIPISLAITTNQLVDNNSISSLPIDVKEFGGTILNHSHTHPINWGGTKEKIRKEIEKASEIIKKVYGIRTDYAVSPFHHLTWDSLEVLEELNYKGVVAGISSSHHEFLITKGGVINTNSDIIVHSQQCMLHGDCLSDYREIDEYLYSFYFSSMLGFSNGFLDHPISKRYDYGWGSIENQFNNHEKIIEFLSNQKIKLINQEEMFNRLKAKEDLEIHIKLIDSNYHLNVKNNSDFLIAINIGNKKFDCYPLKTTKFTLKKKIIN